MEIQQGEILRRLEILERRQESFVPGNRVETDFLEINREIAELEKRIGKVELKLATAEVERASVSSRIGLMEDTQKWIVRLIIGAVLLALIGTVMRGGIAL